MKTTFCVERQNGKADGRFRSRRRRKQYTWLWAGEEKRMNQDESGFPRVHSVGLAVAGSSGFGLNKTKVPGNQNSTKKGKAQSHVTDDSISSLSDAYSDQLRWYFISKISWEYAWKMCLHQEIACLQALEKLNSSQAWKSLFWIQFWKRCQTKKCRNWY